MKIINMNYSYSSYLYRFDTPILTPILLPILLYHYIITSWDQRDEEHYNIV